MARKPTSRRPRKADVKAAADRAEARAKGETIKTAETPIDPEIILAGDIAKIGRPPGYKPEFAQQAIMLCKLGATDEELALFFKVSVRTIYRWKVQHAEFCQAIKAAATEADDRVERSLYHRAVGYTYDATKIMLYKGEVIREDYKEHVPPDTTAAIFWLKNRKPELWREKLAHEHTGKDGGPIETAVTPEHPGVDQIAEITRRYAGKAVAPTVNGANGHANGKTNGSGLH